MNGRNTQGHLRPDAAKDQKVEQKWQPHAPTRFRIAQLHIAALETQKTHEPTDPSHG